MRYLYQREFGIREQFLGIFDPLLQDILMGGHSCRLLEHGNKVVRAKQRDLREIIERDWLVQMVLNVFANFSFSRWPQSAAIAAN